jgi:hypothetical protein
MHTSKSSENFSITEHIKRKKKEMAETQDLLNEAYQRALSGGKHSVSASNQEVFSNKYVKKTVFTPAILVNTLKKQEGNSDNVSQETKSQFTDKHIHNAKMTQLCMNSVVLDMESKEP